MLYLQNIGDIIGFLIIVTSINMVGLLLSSKLPLNFLFFGMSDRVIGSVIGFFQGGITATVLIAIIAANPNDQISEMLRDSQFTTVILKYFKFVLALMPMMLRQSMEIFFGGL